MRWLTVAISILLAPSASIAQEHFIDFETLPDGSTPSRFDLVDPEAYLESHGVTFVSLDGSVGPGFNWAPLAGDFGLRDGTIDTFGTHIAVEFVRPVTTVSAQILSTQTVMTAFDVGGMQIGFERAGAAGSVLTIEGVGRIDSVVWQSSAPFNTVTGIDDLAFTFLPEPASGALLSLGLVALGAGRRLG